jgi:hypothetical protein
MNAGEVGVKLRRAEEEVEGRREREDEGKRAAVEGKKDMLGGFQMLERMKKKDGRVLARGGDAPARREGKGRVREPGLVDVWRESRARDRLERFNLLLFSLGLSAELCRV